MLLLRRTSSKRKSRRTIKGLKLQRFVLRAPPRHFCFFGAGSPSISRCTRPILTSPLVSAFGIGFSHIKSIIYILDISPPRHYPLLRYTMTSQYYVLRNTMYNFKLARGFCAVSTLSLRSPLRHPALRRQTSAEILGGELARNWTGHLEALQSENYRIGEGKYLIYEDTGDRLQQQGP
jgi:hypothetical protein